MAQQMSIEDLSRLKRQPGKTALDKDFALLDLITEEKGFTILSDGNQPADAQEGDGVITLKLPHKTTHLTIRHPEFGQLFWVVPNGKKLRKNRHYQALLFAADPTKDYRTPKQWVVFHLSPENCIILLDSLTRQVRQDVAEYYLPVGKHHYRVEAPFYDAEEGEFTLSDSTRTDISVHLQPFYSYLTVKGIRKWGDLYIDGAPISSTHATSYRLGEGYHRVSYFYNQTCYYDTLLYVGRSRKEVLELKPSSFYPHTLKRSDPLYIPSDAPSDQLSAEVLAPVKLSCADSLAEIWVDRELKGKGHWEGQLPLGYHLANTRLNGQEGASTSLLLEDPTPREIALMVPGTAFGLLNVHCNVDGAQILLDGKPVGTTPQILRLDASRSYLLRLSKPGYKDKKQQVRPRSNNQTDIHMVLKKK